MGIAGSADPNDGHHSDRREPFKGGIFMFKKRILSLVIIISIIVGTFGMVSFVTANPSQETPQMPDRLINARSGILIEASSGVVLHEFNSHDPMPIASVTKVMTMLLVMEAIADEKIALEDMVTVSAHAAGMGGSQIYLEIGEQMSVDDLLKAVAVSSGNDAAVALAEHISGSEEAFADLMNERARQLGAENSNFDNASGLEEENNYSTAYDIALISRELLNHPKIFEYTTIWMDSLRGGEFGLSNTNRLIRFYDGATGLKTGSTSFARYCLSATALRDDMHLIAIVLGAPTTNDRFNSATRLLDHGFANYAVVNESVIEEPFPLIEITGGVEEEIEVGFFNGLNFVVPRGKQNRIEVEIQLPELIRAPIRAGQKVGEAIFTADGEELYRADIHAMSDVRRINTWQMYMRMLGVWLKG